MNDSELKTLEKKMGEELGQLYFHLSAELSQLHVHWIEFKTIFEKEETQKLLDSTAPTFFSYYRRLVWQEILLGLCRLTDPCETGKKLNLTVRRLPRLIDCEDLQGQVKAAVDATGFARQWRNKHLSHRSLTLTLRKEATPKPAKEQDVASALEEIEVPLKSVCTKYDHPSPSYSDHLIGRGGARWLLRYLSSGLEAQEQREEQGVTDWKPPHYAP